MSPAPTRLPALLRRALAVGRLNLISFTADNIVFRHEIGMNNRGMLNSGSPIFVAHGLMAGWLVAEALFYVLLRWRGVAWGCVALWVVMVLASYPLALARAYQNLARERRSGSLDQLYMSGLDSGDLFAGKYYGLLAPLFEVRRYLALGGVLLAVSVLKIFGGPWFILALVIWLTGINHFGHSVVTGTLAGLKRGLVGAFRFPDLIRDWRLNPWPWHLWLNLKVGAMVGVPFAFLCWLSRRSDWPLYPAFGLILVMPFYVAVHLGARQKAETDRLAAMFRTLMDIEGGGSTGARARRVSVPDSGPPSAAGDR